MRILSVLLPAALALMPAVCCQAANFDGTKPFLCSTTDVAQCVPGQDCARESAGTVNVPQFFTVDIQKGLVTSTENGTSSRTSRIGKVEHLEHLLRLSGGDGEAGWIATVEQDSGKMSLAVIGDQVGFVIFGACLVR